MVALPGTCTPLAVGVDRRGARGELTVEQAVACVVDQVEASWETGALLQMRVRKRLGEFQWPIPELVASVASS